MSSDLNTLNSELAELNAKIAAMKASQKERVKILKKMEKMKLTHKTAHKYMGLQELYMQTIRS